MFTYVFFSPGFKGIQRFQPRYWTPDKRILHLYMCLNVPVYHWSQTQYFRNVCSTLLLPWIQDSRCYAHRRNGRHFHVFIVLLPRIDSKVVTHHKIVWCKYWHNFKMFSMNSIAAKEINILSYSIASLSIGIWMFVWAFNMFGDCVLSANDAHFCLFLYSFEMGVKGYEEVATFVIKMPF